MNKKLLLFSSFFVLILFIGIIYWGNYLSMNGYITPFIIENFNNYTHTVNIPLTSTTDCDNMCGSQNVCNITGEQCVSDVDCSGCAGMNPRDTYNLPSTNIRGQNDAGKQGAYSVLTTDIGTNARLINNPTAPPLQYNQGENTWTEKFNFGNSLFQKKYNPNIQKYPQRTTLSGQFEDDGPLAANDFL